MIRLIRKIKKNVSKISILTPLYTFLHSLRKQVIINREIKKIHKLDLFSKSEVYEYQNNTLLNFIKYAYEQTEYYKVLVDKNKIDIGSIEGFKTLPFLTKSIIKQNTPLLISREYGFNHLAKKNTGGSTGNPLELYCTTEAGLLDYAYHFHQYREMGYKKGDLILGAGAITISQELRDKDIYWLKIGDKEAFGDYKLSILYLNDNTIKFYVDKLLELKPNILRGYPSLFDSLAQYILNNNIKLNFKIKGISLTSEMCSENQRINIEKAFSSKVFFEYGHTEVSVLCHSSNEDHLYKSYPSYGYVEVLNEDGTETPIGEIGKIVVTGFLNKGMPFIRYNTEDLGKVAYRNGGVIHLSAIIGRSQDFILAKDGNKISISALTSWQHFNAFANISKWQIVQEIIGVIKILIVKGTNYSDQDEIEIRTKIQKITNVELSFFYVQTIPPTKGGKHLFLVQKVKI